MGTLSAPGGNRYFTDPQIACVAHQALTGLDIAEGSQPAPSWQICHPSRKALMIMLVEQIRQGKDLPQLYALRPDPGHDWETLPRDRKRRWRLMVLVVAFMASEERDG
jgi:hypothetical protein